MQDTVTQTDTAVFDIRKESADILCEVELNISLSGSKMGTNCITTSLVLKFVLLII